MTSTSTTTTVTKNEKIDQPKSEAKWYKYCHVKSPTFVPYSFNTLSMF